MPANQKRDFDPKSANPYRGRDLATPSIELKKRIGARKKSKNPEKKTDKNRHISKTARIPIGKLYRKVLFDVHLESG